MLLASFIIFLSRYYEHGMSLKTEKLPNSITPISVETNFVIRSFKSVGETNVHIQHQGLSIMRFVPFR